MTVPIDPPRKSEPPRRGRRRADVAQAQDQGALDDRNLPVVVSPSKPAQAPAPEPAPAPGAVFAAQLLGQEGQKRGLRGGPATLDTAKQTYSRTEWSGAADRRARRGGAAKTEA